MLFQKVELPFPSRNALRCYDIYITPSRWGFPVYRGQCIRLTRTPRAQCGGNIDCFFRLAGGLFEAKDKIDGGDEEETRHEMVPAERHAESDGGEDDEDHEGDHLLNDFELHQRERSSVALKTHSVGGHLQAVLEESDAPREENHEDKRRGVGEETDVLQFQVAVPRQGHEDIRR